MCEAGCALGRHNPAKALEGGSTCLSMEVHKHPVGQAESYPADSSDPAMDWLGDFGSQVPSTWRIAVANKTKNWIDTKPKWKVNGHQVGMLTLQNSLHVTSEMTSAGTEISWCSSSSVWQRKSWHIIEEEKLLEGLFLFSYSAGGSNISDVLIWELCSMAKTRILFKQRLLYCVMWKQFMCREARYW